jgi:pseudaminic acid synthase
MKIYNKKISINNLPFIIAEISANHNSSIQRTLKLVREAKKAGADAIKLQTYKAESLTLNSRKPQFIINDKKSLWYKKSLFDLYKKGSLPTSYYKEIFKEAKKNDIICFSTPFDERSVDFLTKFQVPAFKIASFENNHFPLIEKVISKKKPLIISLGATTYNEILYLYKFLRKKKFSNFAFLQCTSSYPARIEESNIKTILDLRKKFKIEIGLSDHTPGIGAAISAISYGASIIEKHFTLDKTAGGLDDAFSMDPDDLSLLVKESKNAWLSLGKIYYGLTKSEKRYKVFKRSIYAKKDIKKGEILSENNIKVIRPNYGLEPKFYKKLLGKVAKRNIKYASPLKKRDIYS